MANSPINLIAAVRFYVDKVVSDPSIGGMKVLLLDSVTTKVVSMVYSLTQVLEKEVYLVEQLGKSHESMKHIKAAVLIQPTEANVEHLMQEISRPKFSEYHLFFTNVVSKEILARLGRHDKFEVIRQVHEYYSDFMAINEDFFHLNIDNSLLLSSSVSRTLETSQIFDRHVSGVLSVLLSLKRRPSQIRYQSSSDLARRLASDMASQIERDDIFDFRRQEGPLLLILDRRNDPITPLLTQWTYQAMVHELLGLNNNRVVLRGSPGISKELEEVVLSCTQDDFFAQTRYSNFGDLGVAIKGMLDEYQKHSKLNQNISSVEDMQAFIERYPDFRSKSINVSKHVAIMSELSRLTDVCQLLDISQLEQDISCSSDRANQKKEVIAKIMDSRVQNADKLRLTLLYGIRYENYDDIRELKAKLLDKGISSHQIAAIDAILEYAGESKRGPGLFSGGGIMSKLTKAISSGVHGAENVYTQHEPILSHILESILKGKIKEASFPLILGNASSKFSEVIVFIVGGATFEESTKVAEFNNSNPGLRVILGGSCVHNSISFLKEINDNFGK